MVTFDAAATGFSLDNARLLGQAAAVAYQPALVCEQWAKSQGLDGAFDFFSSAGLTRRCDTQGFVVENDQMILIAFRGTEPNEAVDWLSDFEAVHETWGYSTGKVHKGFYEAFRAVWGVPIGGKEILPARLLNRGNRTVWITGHSLGGALAEVCAAHAYFVSHVPVQGVYTFGQPRVGDEPFAQVVHAAFGARILRMINDKDIVPRVPLFGMGFRHYGNQIFFDHQHQQETGTASVENLAAALSLAKLALTTDAIQEAAKMLAAAAIQAGFHGNPLAILSDMVKVREDAALGAARILLKAGTANLADHDMRKNYLARLGTDLVIGQNA